MVDTSLVAFRLLELVALLFPVVALLLQLQYRAVDTEELARKGLIAGIGFLLLLDVSFLLVTMYLINVDSMPLLLSVALVTTALLGVQLPVIVVLSSQTLVDGVEELCSSFVRRASRATVTFSDWFGRRTDRSDETEE